MTKVSDLCKKLSKSNRCDSSLTAQRDSSEESSVVEKVILDIVDYVVRKEEFLTLDIPYDSDYIPTNTLENKNEPCSRHCCQKGCVCASIKQKVVAKHCKKEDCLFYCICNRRLVNSLRKLPHRKTVKIMLTNRSNNSRSTKRLKRVRKDEASPPEIPFIDLSADDTPIIPTTETINNEADESSVDIRNPSNRNSLLTTEKVGKVDKVVVERNLLAYREMFVWCPAHCRYICNCQGRVFDLRNNLVKQNPEADMASGKASLDHLFNTEDHCARTIGSVFNYRLRNLNRIFALKRDYEIKKGVLANSNSSFKINPIQSKLALESKTRSTSKKISMKRAENRSKTGTSNGVPSNLESFTVKATKVASPSPLEPKIQLIFHDNSDSSEEETEDTSSLPKFGLLCLNGYGYLPIKEFNSTKLVFQHPVIKNIFVSKKNLDEANLWLNDLLKSFMSTDSQHTVLQWVVVQRGVLKISKSFNLKNLKD
ncbi:uncharacterized protein [Halyomorpha halys]|nr:uncharacterized protein LOC106680725 isoform X2 [Halyomorpha halys]XP_014276114.1 uncharacterized protein LOC106680725 isoform X2 [Halyomorpha halys]XP_014276115.1 uncharacterized protein LOC106680725 isoform X2 [Halyomorpha halys]XP_014276117.1 uncharacterized protein LOC106680725 isoform X2 [Halyomorpha halys]XP_014276118.1 uncharacterized protein LOC106680725 isoform X2 [Halyomorpha halys]